MHQAQPYSSDRHLWVGIVICGLVGALGTSDSFGQEAAEAAVGDPFGVARFTIEVPSSVSSTAVETRAFSISERNGRLHYPAFSSQGGRGLLARVLGGRSAARAKSVTVSFLFTGEAPLEVSIAWPERRTVRIEPNTNQTQFRRLRDTWWRDYWDPRQTPDADNVSEFRWYLATMLARRMGLTQPALESNRRLREEPKATVSLLSLAPSLRAAAFRRALTTRPVAASDHPFPKDIAWPETPSDPAAEVRVEPIARFVPEECFYVRFGDFKNYLWFSDLLDEKGNQIGQVVTREGSELPLAERLEEQLALQDSPLAELFGDKLISDVAIIGRDLYLEDGAALGMLFEAKSTEALGIDVRRQRATALRANRDAGATEVEVMIEGESVPFLSTPDNRVRSFYVVRDKYHLVTTSKEIAGRFLQASHGIRTLADSPDFHHARQLMPDSRQDTVFAYFSPPFLRGLVSPRYQIELSRRLAAQAEIRTVELALLAARAERLEVSDIESLVDAGLLPADYVSRAARLEVQSGEVRDRIRGKRGAFLPVTDVPLGDATASEVAAYRQRAAFFASEWRKMDPLAVGIKRYAVQQEDEKTRERLVLDAIVSPLVEDKYGWALSLLGAPAETSIRMPHDTIASVEAIVRGGLLVPSIPRHHLFAGVPDLAPIAGLSNGLLNAILMFRTTPGFLGAWPEMGFLDLLPIRPTSEVDEFGFSRYPLGVWRWQGGGFSVLSFHRRQILHAAEELQAEPTENPAQIRLRIGDLSNSQLASWLTLLSYERARTMSHDNVRAMHDLSHQFRVSRRNAREHCEQLINARLVCALGGEFELVSSDDGLVYWNSTAWPQPGDRSAQEYEAVLLSWFRGLSLDVTKLSGELALHGELDLPRDQDENPLFELPLFNLLDSE